MAYAKPYDYRAYYEPISILFQILNAYFFKKVLSLAVTLADYAIAIVFCTRRRISNGNRGGTKKHFVLQPSTPDNLWYDIHSEKLWMNIKKMVILDEKPFNV